MTDAEAKSLISDLKKLEHLLSIPKLKGFIVYTNAEIKELFGIEDKLLKNGVTMKSAFFLRYRPSNPSLSIEMASSTKRLLLISS